MDTPRFVVDRNIRLILILLFLHMLLVGMTQLSIPLYSLTLGASQVMLGIIVGAFGASGIVLSIPNGVLSDYLGRRTMMAISFVCWIGAGAASLLAPPIPWLACAQIMVGLADVCFGISSMTYLTEIAPQGKNAEIQSLGSGFIGLGLAAGPVLAGRVCHLVSFQSVFALVVLLGILGLILSCRLASTELPGVKEGSLVKQLILSHREAVVLLRSNRSVRLAVWLTFLGTMSWMTVGASSYITYLNRLGLASDTIGLLTTLRASAAMLAQFNFAYLARRIGVFAATVLGFAIGGGALMATPFLTGVPVLALVGCVGDAADRLRVPGIYTMIADGTHQASRALAVALVSMAWAVATAVTAAFLGVVGERVSLSATFLLVGPLVILSAVLLYAWDQRAA